MFGLWKPSCPVDPETRSWIEERTHWLAVEFGIDRSRGTRVILPSPEFFPDKYDRSPEAATRMFDRVRGYMGLGDARVQLGFYAEDRGPNLPMQPGITYSHEGTAGLFVHGARGRVGPDEEQTVWVEVRQLANPLALVATLAHELGHVHLIGHGRITNEGRTTNR